MIDRNGGTKADIKSRIGKGQAAFTSSGKIWKTEDCDETKTVQTQTSKLFCFMDQRHGILLSQIRKKCR